MREYNKIYSKHSNTVPSTFWFPPSIHSHSHDKLPTTHYPYSLQSPHPISHTPSPTPPTPISPHVPPI